MSESYDVYRPPGGTGAGAQPVSSTDAEPAAGTGAWQVLVEYSNQGQAKPPTKVAIWDEVHDTFDAAHLAAREVATTWEPPDPAFPKARRLYSDGPGFLTVIDGAMSTFHFSTRVVSRLE